MITIRTTVIDENFNATTEVNIDEFLFRKAATILDFPSPHASGAELMFCSSAVEIKMVMNDRKLLSDAISKAVSKQLMEFMSTQDTVMGYKVTHKKSTTNSISGDT